MPRYDTDGNRKLTRDEMPPLLADLKIDLRTALDSEPLLSVPDAVCTPGTKLVFIAVASKTRWTIRGTSFALLSAWC